MNVLSMYALIGAYSPEGYVWVDELLKVLGQNIDYACGFIDNFIPDVEVTRPEGTYMLFIARGQERASMMCSVLHGESASRYRMDARSTENATQGSIWHFRFQE